MEESEDHTIEESDEFNLVLDVSSSDVEGDESKKPVGVTSQPTEMRPVVNAEIESRRSVEGMNSGGINSTLEKHMEVTNS